MQDEIFSCPLFLRNKVESARDDQETERAEKGKNRLKTEKAMCEFELASLGLESAPSRSCTTE